MTVLPWPNLGIVVRPEEISIWAWKHGRGKVEHAVKERLTNSYLYTGSPGIFRSDRVTTFCGLNMEYTERREDHLLPWCKRCAAALDALKSKEAATR